MIHVKQLALGISFALAASITSAHADSAEARSVVVSTKGLDLSQPADVERLYARLRRAAREVCEPLESRSAVTQTAWRTCKEGALARAVAAVDHPALSKRHFARRGGEQLSAS